MSDLIDKYKAAKQENEWLRRIVNHLLLLHDAETVEIQVRNLLADRLPKITVQESIIRIRADARPRT